MNDVMEGCLVFALFTLVCFISGVVFLRDYKRWSCCDMVTTGKCLEVKRYADNKNGHIVYRYYGVYLYEVNGVVYMQKNRVNVYQHEEEVPHDVDVRYESKNPENFTFCNPKGIKARKYLSVGFFTASAVSLALFAVYILKFVI